MLVEHLTWGRAEAPPTVAPVEKRYNPLNNPADMRIWTAGATSDAGIRISDETLLEFSPIWSGITQISGDISQTPLYVYRRVEGGKERAKRHPAYRLLRRRAGPETPAHVWLQVMITDALLYGRAYSRIMFDTWGRPNELIHITPDRMQIRADTNGKRWHCYIADDGQFYPVPLEELFYVQGLTLDTVGGLSLVDYARNSVGRGLAAEKYSNRFFANDARPGGLLVHPGRMDDVAINELRNNWASQHAGTSNAGRFGILEEGMQWVPIGINPEEAQMIASLEFGVKDAARVLSIPAHRLGDDVKSSYNSLEQENLAYQQSCLGRWYYRIQEEAYIKLLTVDQQKNDTHTVEFERNRILQADASTRVNVYSKGINDGWLNRDEVRGMENLNAIPDGAGKDFLKPAAAAPVAAEDEPDEDEPEADDSGQDDRKAAMDRLMTRTLDWAAKRLRHYLERAAKDGAKFVNEVDNLHRHDEVIADRLVDVVGAWRACGMECPDADMMAKSFVEGWRQTMAAIAEVTPEGELFEAVLKELDR